jgi:lysine 6-dehydrogenase
MGFRYAVIGSGMQGTAAAYDLARFGNADEVRLLDVDRGRADAAAARVNQLVGKPVAKAGVVDATDSTSASQVLEGMNACLSAVPYFLNEMLARAAVAARVHFNDLGGNTEVVRRTLAIDEEAAEQGVSVVPDCGVAPGMANTLAAHGIRKLDTPEHVHIRCGGLPENRELPLGYKVLFALEGLTNEYFGKALVLRDGHIREIDTFEELETITFPEPLGKLEAFVTSGGTSTCPATYRGRLSSYDYKTIRYPGHYEKLKLLRDLGFIELDPIEVRGHKVVPRDVFHAIMKRAWDFPKERDLLILRVDVEGRHQGKPARYRAQLIDRQDSATGFSAMERTTAYSAAIVTAMQARGDVPKGAQPLEKAVDPETFVAELRKRGFSLEVTAP